MHQNSRTPAHIGLAGSFGALSVSGCGAWARPCRLIQCPVGGSVSGCGARAVSRKTPIYFMYILLGEMWKLEIFSPFVFCDSAELRRAL